MPDGAIDLREKPYANDQNDLREKPNANNQNEEEFEVTDGVDKTAVSTFPTVAHVFTLSLFASSQRHLYRFGVWLRFVNTSSLQMGAFRNVCLYCHIIQHRGVESLDTRRRTDEPPEVAYRRGRNKNGIQPSQRVRGYVVALSNTDLAPMSHRKQYQNVEIERVMAQLAQAQAEITKARAVEEASELTLGVLLAQNKDLETSRAAVERRCQEQVERFEAEIAQVGSWNQASREHA